jgi:excisionase family DNA binding protein
MAVRLEIYGLIRVVRAWLRRDPERAAKAAVTAIEQEVHRTDRCQADPPPQLAPYIDELPSGPEIIGPSEAARRLGVSRQTLYDWAHKGSVLAWRTSKRGLKVPAEQIVGSGDVVSGIDRVLAVLPDPEFAWAFLSEEQPFADAAERPIEKLKRGDVDDVVAAAKAFGDAPV